MKRIAAVLMMAVALPAFAVKEKKINPQPKEEAHPLTVTLDVKDAEVRDILKSMQRQCGIKNLAIDPDREFDPDPDALAALQHAIERWLPGAELVQVDICPYDNTADEEFIVARIDGIVVGAGTSGHAFKFGPLLGDQLGRLVLDGR